jgi:hypothetical protein
MSILDRYNEEHLLAYVEEQLDPAEAEVLNEQLAREPQIRAILDRMRRERAALRAMGTPAAPVDFVAELEPQLARPMLIDPVPGAYRRHHRRKTRARRLMRYALAAGVVIAVSGGFWAAYTFIGNPFSITDGDRLVRNDDSSPSTADALSTRTDDGSFGGDDASDETLWPPPDAIVVHGTPVPLERGGRAVRTHAVRSGDEARPLIAAPFAVVLEASDMSSAEAMLADAVAALEPESGARGETTLVRNFTLAEAEILVNRMFAASGSGPAPPDYVAWIGNERRRAIPEAERAKRLREIGRDARRLRSERCEDDEPWFSEVLAGSEALMPSYEQQLALSGRGATHALSVPASRLAELIAHLRDESGTSVLRTLPVAGGAKDPRAVMPLLEPSGAVTASRWVDDLRTIRAFLAELPADAGGERRIVLPVRVETRPPAERSRRGDRRSSRSR